MEVKREPLGPAGASAGQRRAPSTLRVQSLNARQLLRGGELEGANQPAHLEGAELERYVEERVLTTTLDNAVAWARSNSFFPLAFGLACCAMEQIPRRRPAHGHRALRLRGVPRLPAPGRPDHPRRARVDQDGADHPPLYDQMLEPKWAISMGACCSSMGVFNNYALVPADKFMPIDVHVPGCPPRPEALMHGVLKLRKMVQDDPDVGWRERYDAVGTEESPPRCLTPPGWS